MSEDGRMKQERATTTKFSRHQDFRIDLSIVRETRNESTPKSVLATNFLIRKPPQVSNMLVNTLKSKPKIRVSKKEVYIPANPQFSEQADSFPFCDHNSRFLLRSSGGSSSPSRSAVSAGLSRECTLLAILLRRVGPGLSRPLKGKRAPGICHPASLVLA